MSPITYSEWLFGMLNTRLDEVEQVTTHTHKSSPDKSGGSYIHLLIREKPGHKPTLFLRITYASSRWLFVEDYTLRIDGEKQRLNPKTKIVRYVAGAASIMEWQTIAVDDGLRKTLEKIAASKRTILRYNGRDFRDDLIITQKAKSNLDTMLKIFDAKVALHAK